MKNISLYFLVCLFGLTFAVPAKKFAFLVATTKSWIYYRHQSTLLHAYQTLIANDFPREQIITMFYDDIAYHPKNPELGVIRNQPFGENVYENVKKDYTGKKVNVNNFVAVLMGNSSQAEGPVIQSDARDSLFLYICGMGTAEYLSFPSGPGITARKLVQILEDMRNYKKIDKIYINIETPFSSTLFDGILSNSNRSKEEVGRYPFYSLNVIIIFVSAATYQYEFPYAVYCDPNNKICYGSLYGVAWTQYSDRLRQLKSGEKATLFDQFNHVRSEIPYTHVIMLGDLSLGSKKLKDFLGYKLERKPTNSLKVGQAAPYVIKNEELLRTGNNYHGFNHTFATEFGYQNNRMNKGRDFVKETMKTIFNQLFSYGHKNLNYKIAGKHHSLLSEEQSNTYEQVIREFQERCFNINENPFVLQEMPKLAYLCKAGVTMNEQIKAMSDTCTSKHRFTLNIH